MDGYGVMNDHRDVKKKAVFLTVRPGFLYHSRQTSLGD